MTVIELLSPTNKYAGPDREQYLVKRRELLASPVHFVEIDLLRGGPRMPMQDLPECDYCVLVSRVETRLDAGLWPIRLREPIRLRQPSPSPGGPAGFSSGASVEGSRTWYHKAAPAHRAFPQRSRTPCTTSTPTST